MLTILLVLVCVALLLKSILDRWLRPLASHAHPLPPSPGIALPVIGHLHLLEENPREQFRKWGDRLGPLFSLYLGSNLVIVLNGYDVIKEALVTNADKFSNRPYTYISSTLSKNTGFVTPGTGWQTQRKISLEIMRKLGQNTGAVEGIVHREVAAHMTLLRLQDGGAHNPRGRLANSVSTIVYSLLFGPEFSMEDKDTDRCVKMIADQSVLLEGMIALDFLPFLKYLPGDMFGIKKAMQMRDFVDDNLILRLMALKKEQSGCEEADDFISHYLREIEMQRKSGRNNPDVNEDNLVAVVFTILIAAIDTTTIAILWGLLYLLHNPKVQERCYEEISQTVGLDRCVEVKDTAHLPYVEATVLEVFRRASISPFSIHHTVTEDVVMRGCVIPKDTIIMPCLDSALHSQTVWGDPFNFRPERFLDDKETRVVTNENFVPFSMGPRKCFGEKLSKMTLMLFLTSTIQEFHIRSPPNTPLPTLKDKFGLNCQPLPYDVCFMPR